jgi:hypothetical protein
MDLAQLLMLEGSESFICGDFRIGRQLRLRREVEVQAEAVASQALSYFNENFPILAEHPYPLQEAGMAIRAALIERAPDPRAHLYRLIFEAAFRQVGPPPTGAVERSSAAAQQAQL